MKACWIQIAHRLPGRTRLRCPPLRKNAALCERFADALGTYPNVQEVSVRPYTGSVLIMHERTVDSAEIALEAARLLGCKKIIQPGEPTPVPTDVPPFSAVARQLVQAVYEIDRDIRRHTDGSVDLGTLAALGMFGAGVAEIAGTGEVPLPPWFNLAWWGFRTFVTTEQGEIDAVIG